MAKNASRNLTPILFLGMIGIGILIMVIGSYMTGSFVSVTPTGGCREVQESYEDCGNVQVPYTEQQCDSIPYTDKECELKELTYKSSIDEIQRNVVCIEDHQECQKYVLGICTDWKTICDKYKETCSFDVTNLDTERGTWYFTWYRSCRAAQPDCMLTEPTEIYSSSLYLDPTETKDTTATITYNADGQEFCYALFSSTPTKQVCRDVIKYRQECKDITKYRTEYRCETKYRTITKCD